MRILLIGATGQLGSDLIKNNSGDDIIAPRRTELDLTRSETIAAAVRDSRADWVINTAAFHNVPLCEEQPEQAFRVNCVAVRDLAQACSAHHARLMTFSSKSRSGLGRMNASRVGRALQRASIVVVPIVPTS